MGRAKGLSALEKETTNIPIIQSTSWLNMVTQTHYQTLQKICPVDPSPGYRMVNKHHCFINSRHFGSLICSHRSSLGLSVHFSWLKKKKSIPRTQDSHC